MTKRYTDYEDEKYWNVIKDNETGEILDDAEAIASILNEKDETIYALTADLETQKDLFSDYKWRVQETLQKYYDQKDEEGRFNARLGAGVDGIISQIALLKNIARILGVELND